MATLEDRLKQLQSDVADVRSKLAFLKEEVSKLNIKVVSLSKKCGK